MKAFSVLIVLLALAPSSHAIKLLCAQDEAHLYNAAIVADTTRTCVGGLRIVIGDKAPCATSTEQKLEQGYFQACGKFDATGLSFVISQARDARLR